jgi:pteridine reductase
MKTVLVTGGTVRLGKVIADYLRAAGWRVLTSSHRPDSGADLIADLSEEMGAAKLYAGCINLLGGNPPDALVNNAALFTGDEAAMASVNLEAPRKLVMMMAGREDGRGKVVNILDTRVLSQPAADAYGRTKRDLMEWSAKAAAMFADTLNVNSVAPGPVLAPVGVHEAAGECPLGRPTPEAVARAVGFLLEADYTSGCVIAVDGGQSL